MNKQYDENNQKLIDQYDYVEHAIRALEYSAHLVSINTVLEPERANKIISKLNSDLEELKVYSSDINKKIDWDEDLYNMPMPWDFWDE